MQKNFVYLLFIALFAIGCKEDDDCDTNYYYHDVDYTSSVSENQTFTNLFLTYVAPLPNSTDPVIFKCSGYGGNCVVNLFEVVEGFSFDSLNLSATDEHTLVYKLSGYYKGEHYQTKDNISIGSSDSGCNGRHIDKWPVEKIVVTNWEYQTNEDLGY